MALARDDYADWCDNIANNYIDEANVLEDYGMKDKAKLSAERAEKLYAEARLIRTGQLDLDEFATRMFLNRKVRH